MSTEEAVPPPTASIADDDDLQQTRLPSGRGIRFKLLMPSQCDKVLKFAAEQITGESTQIEYRRILGRTGAEAMITEVTEKKFLSSAALKAPDVKWLPFAAADYEKWFRNPKDHEGLCDLYFALHHVNAMESQAIVGESTPVVR